MYIIPYLLAKYAKLTLAFLFYVAKSLSTVTGKFKLSDWLKFGTTKVTTAQENEVRQ